jgi:hypothetical protein
VGAILHPVVLKVWNLHPSAYESSAMKRRRARANTVILKKTTASALKAALRLLEEKTRKRDS